MSKIQEYSYKNITLKAAVDYASLQLDAFKEDAILKSFIPESGQFGQSKLPSIIDFNQLMAKVDLFSRLAKGLGRHVYQDLCWDHRQRIFLMTDKNDKAVAGCQWILPSYMELPKMGWIAYFAYMIRAVWFKILDVSAFIFLDNPFAGDGFFNEVAWGKKMVGADDSPEREQELMKMSPEELAETTYPRSLTYYLKIMAVRVDEHGKGYGKKLINAALAELGPYERPKHIMGPAKASLLSTPSARGFYLAGGWSLGAVAEHTLSNGQHSPHAYFYKNLK